MATTKLPTSLNYEDLIALGAAARLLATGQADQIDRRQAFAAAWGVAGYAGGRMIKDAPVASATGATAPTPDVDWNAVADQCDQASAPKAGAKGTGKTKGKVSADAAAGLDWKTLLAAALKLLALLLA